MKQSYRICVQEFGRTSPPRYRADLLIGQSTICKTSYGASPDEAAVSLEKACTGAAFEYGHQLAVGQVKNVHE